MNRLSPFHLVPFVAFVFILLVPRTGAAGERPLVALVGATTSEVAALHKEFGVEPGDGRFTLTTLRGVRFYRGAVDGHDVVIFQAGTSIVNAAFQMQLALDHFPVTHVLFAGIAGGIDPALRVGDIVIPAQWAYHTETAYLNEDGHGGYVQTGRFAKRELENYGMIFPRSLRAIREGEEKPRPMPFFPADAALLDAARRALPKLSPLKQAGRTVAVSVGGVGVAGAVSLHNAKYREWVFKVWQARALDMESTAYAQVCWANAKPLLIIRGLSDLAGGEPEKNPPDPKERQEVFDNGAKVLHAVLNELPK